MKHLYYPFDTDDDITNLLYLNIIIFPLFVEVSNCHVVVVVVVVVVDGDSGCTAMIHTAAISECGMNPN